MALNILPTEITCANLKQILESSPKSREMTDLFTKYPDMFATEVLQALRTLTDKTELTSYELVTLAPVFECNLVKSYLTISANDSNRNSIKQALDMYLEAIAKMHSVQRPRAFTQHFYQLLNIKIKFTDTYAPFLNKARAGIVSLPKMETREHVITSDIQQMIMGNLTQLNECIRDTPIERFNFIPEKKKVIFDTAILQAIIRSQIILQNTMTSHNWNNYIKTGRFLDLNVTPDSRS